MSDKKKDTETAPLDAETPSEPTTDETIITLGENPMPAPPAGDADVTVLGENPMPSGPAKGIVTMGENPMPAPPALGLDNK